MTMTKELNLCYIRLFQMQCNALELTNKLFTTMLVTHNLTEKYRVDNSSEFCPGYVQ